MSRLKFFDGGNGRVEAPAAPKTPKPPPRIAFRWVNAGKSVSFQAATETEFAQAAPAALQRLLAAATDGGRTAAGGAAVLEFRYMADWQAVASSSAQGNAVVLEPKPVTIPMGRVAAGERLKPTEIWGRVASTVAFFETMTGDFRAAGGVPDDYDPFADEGENPPAE